MKNTKDAFIPNIIDTIYKNILELLEQKHLYQNIKIDFSQIDKQISSLEFSDFNAPIISSVITHSKKRDGLNLTATIERQKIKDNITKIINGKWRFVIKDEHFSNYYDKKLEEISELVIPLPTIKINCNYCDSINPPHNPGYIGYEHNLPNLFFEKESNVEKKTVQLYFLPYQCQSCKRKPIIFTISRRGFKLQLVGRSQFENLNVPKYIPSEEKEYYSDAIIANNAGRLLAALFYLRALVEHYLRRILNNDSKISGDELGEQYSKLLDAEFPKKFTSLKTIYSELSDKLHKFDKSEEQFKKSISDIEKHFDLLQHFSLKLVEKKTKTSNNNKGKKTG